MTHHPRCRLDVESFFAALDRKRRQRGLSWQAVSRQTGVGAHAFTGMGLHGKKLHVDALITLCDWADLDVRNFLFDRWDPVLGGDPAFSLNGTSGGDAT